MRTLETAYRLDGRSAIVTGASRGIGRGIAKLLAGAGANVVLASRTVDDLQSLEREITESGGRALAVPTDLAVDGDIERLVERTKKEFDGVDVVVNNAAAPRLSVIGPTDEVSPETFQTSVDINLRGPFRLCQLAAREMMAQGRGGSIVNITSIGAKIGSPGFGIYGATKAALTTWSFTMAGEWGQYGIRVNCVGPGFTASDENLPVRENPEALARITAGIPLGRIGSAEDVAYATLFLASDAAAYITGQALYVDGGGSASSTSTPKRPS